MIFGHSYCSDESAEKDGDSFDWVADCSPSVVCGGVLGELKLSAASTFHDSFSFEDDGDDPRRRRFCDVINAASAIEIPGQPTMMCMADSTSSTDEPFVMTAPATPSPPVQTSASPMGSPASSPPKATVRSRRPPVRVKQQKSIINDRASFCRALYQGNARDLSSSLERLSAVPQAIWPMLFQMACLTTCPLNVCQRLDRLFSITSAWVMTEADSYLPEMARDVNSDTRSLATYELFSLASLTPFMVKRSSVPTRMTFPWLSAGSTFGALELRGDLCGWDVRGAFEELGDALLAGDRLRSVQCAFALIAAGRNHSAKLRCTPDDAKGRAFLSCVTSALGISQFPGVELSITLQRRRNGLRAEASVYVLISYATEMCPQLSVEQKREIRKICLMAFKATDTNNYFSPYAMAAALISALMTSIDQRLAPAQIDSCMSMRRIAFSGTQLGQSWEDTAPLYDPEDLVLGDLCCLHGDPLSSVWTLIESAQFGRTENTRTFDGRVHTVLTAMWRNWFPKARAVLPTSKLAE